MEIEGLTGDIRFNEDGRRENYTLNVVEMTVNSAMVKVAEWSDQAHFVPMHVAPERSPPSKLDFERNRTYVVTTIIEEPYIMLKKIKPGDIVDKKDEYEGYCKDLADLLAKKLGINCKYWRILIRCPVNCILILI